MFPKEVNQNLLHSFVLSQRKQGKCRQDTTIKQTRASKSQQWLVENQQYFLVAAVTTSSKATVHQLKASPTEISANERIKALYLVFIQHEDNESCTSHFFLFSLTNTNSIGSTRVRPHVGSTTGTNKNLLLNPLILTCWYEQLQIFNWGPYVQDVLILKKTPSSVEPASFDYYYSWIFMC